MNPYASPLPCDSLPRWWEFVAAVVTILMAVVLYPLFAIPLLYVFYKAREWTCLLSASLLLGLWLVLAFEVIGSVLK